MAPPLLLLLAIDDADADDAADDDADAATPADEPNAEFGPAEEAPVVVFRNSSSPVWRIM